MNIHDIAYKACLESFRRLQDRELLDPVLAIWGREQADLINSMIQVELEGKEPLGVEAAGQVYGELHSLLAVMNGILMYAREGKTGLTKQFQGVQAYVDEYEGEDE